MKNILHLFIISMIVFSMESCTPSVVLEKQLEARSGLDVAVAQLPSMPDFTTVKIVYREFYDDEHGGEHVCYYARAFYIIGSSSSAKNLPEVYAERLQALGLGWSIRDYDKTILYRGDKERAVVYSVEPDDAVKDAIDYIQLRKSYRNIIFLQMEYILPGRGEC